MDNTPNQAGPPEDQQPLSVGDVAQILRRRLWVLILVPLAISGSALAFSLLQRPTYEASATVLVGQQQGQGDSPARVEELQALIPSALEIITTRPVAEEATSGLDLAIDPEAVPENLSAEQTIESGQLIEVSYTDTDARRSEQLVNAVGEVASERISRLPMSAHDIKATVVEAARVPRTREEPDLLRNAILAGGLGTMIGFGLAFVGEVVDSSYGKPAKGPLENLVAFKPKEELKPSKEHNFRLQIPLYESAVVPLQGKQPPPEPFPGEPFVFNFEVPVHAVSVVDVNQKATAKGVTLRLDQVIDSPGRPRAVICYEPLDDKHSWLSYGGEGTFQGGWSTSDWSGTGSMRSIPPAKCQKLMLKSPAEGRTSFEVRMLEGWPDCDSIKEESAWQACMEKRYRTIRGPWRFEFKVQDLAGGAGPEREADD